MRFMSSSLEALSRFLAGTSLAGSAAGVCVWLITLGISPLLYIWVSKDTLDSDCLTASAGISASLSASVSSSSSSSPVAVSI